MANLEGMKYKFTVIKNKDVEKYLSPSVQNTLWGILNKIQAEKVLIGGKLDNKYLVINTDEPYTDEVIEILKRNGHWG